MMHGRVVLERNNSDTRTELGAQTRDRSLRIKSTIIRVLGPVLGALCQRLSERRVVFGPEPP